MILLNSQPYGSKGKCDLTKFNYENTESAISRLVKLYHTEIYSANKYWIEDEQGNILLSSKQTKMAAAKRKRH